MRHQVPVAAHVVFLRDNEVLLGKRAIGTWAEGMWHLPSGHLEVGEPIDVAACREAAEEVGIDLTPEDLQFAHVMHHREGNEYISFFFVVRAWSGEPTNNEPNKCDALEWFPLDRLPENIVPYCRQALRSILDDAPFDASRFLVGANP